ncbi:LacI family DNA-binding transcriptional regulator [Sphaerisporangium rufum]|uniref:LacI family DNA-binding transcriptional regulator n=1 Tax=Sphaerisporangium rufum TaxID=1381558 RepID=UPI001951707D|nr:LacI family DNA-binding transcriptional regulator [Sphaerisporangium rufum]
MTATDVAKATGVSRATVGFVLNNTPGQSITAATRAKVLAAAERLGYTPYAPARALRSGRTSIVVMLLSQLPGGPVVNAVTEHLTALLAEDGLTLLVHMHPGRDEPVSALWGVVTPAAVIAFDRAWDEELAPLRRAGIPVVTPFVDPPDDLDGAVPVMMQRIGRLQVDHLVLAGHTRLGFALPDDPRLAPMAGDRLEGARFACAELGLDLPQVATVPLEVAAAAEAVAGWRAGPAPVTAVCAYNDEVAIAVLSGAHRLGVAVPGELAVIGVDDVPLAAAVSPPLTTIATHPATLSRYLYEALAAALADGPVPHRPATEMLAVTVRGSV